MNTLATFLKVSGDINIKLIFIPNRVFHLSLMPALSYELTLIDMKRKNHDKIKGVKDLPCSSIWSIHSRNIAGSSIPSWHLLRSTATAKGTPKTGFSHIITEDCTLPGSTKIKRHNLGF